MKVDYYLLQQTNVGDLIEFTHGGWRIGITYIDSEDLFLQSLSTDLLQAEVVHENEDRNLYIGHPSNPVKVEVTRSIEIEY